MNVQVFTSPMKSSCTSCQSPNFNSFLSFPSFWFKTKKRLSVGYRFFCRRFRLLDFQCKSLETQAAFFGHPHHFKSALITLHTRRKTQKTSSYFECCKIVLFLFLDSTTSVLFVRNISVILRGLMRHESHFSF